MTNNFMNNLTTFYIFRHGQTEYNVQQRIQGHVDSPLTEEGIVKIKEVAEKFKDVHFDEAFSSDLLRAKRTAEIIKAERDLEIKTTEILRERYFGKYEGATFDAVKAYDHLKDKLSDQERYTFTDGEVESDEQIVTRLTTFIRETAITHPGKSVLVATHGSLIRIFLIHLGYGSYTSLGHGAIDNVAWLKLETDGVDFFLKEVEGVRKTD
jgi:broad specificity phosphatase PhoE